MSERLPFNYEQDKKHEHDPQDEAHARHEKIVEPEKQKTPHELEQLLKNAEKHARSAEDMEAKDDNHRSGTHKSHIAHGTHVSSSARQVQEVQRHLRGTERQFSKFIHNSTVEAVSDVAGATIARPSVLLVGGIASFISSIIVVFICRFYGYEYNYTIGLVSLFGGFILGAIFELSARALKR